MGVNSVMQKHNRTSYKIDIIYSQHICGDSAEAIKVEKQGKFWSCDFCQPLSCSTATAVKQEQQ